MLLVLPWFDSIIRSKLNFTTSSCRNMLHSTKLNLTSHLLPVFWFTAHQTTASILSVHLLSVSHVLRNNLDIYSQDGRYDVHLHYIPLFLKLKGLKATRWSTSFSLWVVLLHLFLQLGPGRRGLVCSLVSTWKCYKSTIVQEAFAISCLASQTHYCASNPNHNHMGPWAALEFSHWQKTH